MLAKDLKPGWFFSEADGVLRLCEMQTVGWTLFARLGNKVMEYGSITDNSEVTHHPDCTGWDYVIPKRVRLEVGKRYRLRNGKATGVMRSYSDLIYPFYDGVDWWMSDGKWKKSGRDDERDIVSEYVEPEPAIDCDCDCRPAEFGKMHVPFTQTTFKPHAKKWLIENSMPGLWLRAERVRPSGVLVGSSWIEWDRLLSGFRFLGGGVCGEARE